MKKTKINAQVGVSPGWKKPVLNVYYPNGKVRTFKISKPVANSLIASGMNYEG